METIFEVGSGIGKHSYWYNYAIYNGKLVVDGFYPSEESAQQFGYKNIPTQFSTISLNTKDRNKAVQIIKRRVWEETHDLDFALKRASRKKPENNDALE